MKHTLASSFAKRGELYSSTVADPHGRVRVVALGAMPRRLFILPRHSLLPLQPLRRRPRRSTILAIADAVLAIADAVLALVVLALDEETRCR